ncbi:hypothetical protein DKP78_14470, partial [Enterococcus faecium]
ISLKLLTLVFFSVHVYHVRGSQKGDGPFGPPITSEGLETGFPGPSCTRCGNMPGVLGFSLCQCPKRKMSVSRRNIKDFNIELFKPSCGTEIILILQNGSKGCLSPDGRQGRKLVICWNRINHDKRQKMKCIPRIGASAM